MSDNTQGGLHSARPRILVDGRDDSALVEGMQRLEMVESSEGLHRCEVTFANWGARDGGVDFLYLDRSRLEFGKAFAVRLEDGTLFEGRISGLEAAFPEGSPAEITVLAEDRFQDLRMTRRTRTFLKQTDAEVIRRIAEDHRLQAEVQVPGPTHDVLAQVNQSDLAFLRERARTLDAEVWAEGSTLKAATRTARRGQPLELSHGHQLRSFTVLADLAHQRSEVAVAGWDVSAKSAIRHVAGPDAIRAELGGSVGGSTILEKAFGRRTETIAHAVPVNREEARSLAESYFKAMARRFVVGRGVAETQVRLRVGAVVGLKNLGRLFDGDYYVVEASHRFDSRRGLWTEFVAERAGLGQVT